MKALRREHGRLFWCNTCNSDREMSAIQMKEHLQIAHAIEGKISGTRKLKMALDGEGFYCNTFDLTLPNGIELTEESSGPA